MQTHRVPLGHLLFLACFLLFISRLQGQQGNYLLRNVTGAEASRLGQVNALAQYPDGRLIIGSSEGVAIYDGRHWTHVPTPSEVRSLALGKDGRIYVGCFRSKAVYLAPDPTNKGTYKAYAVPGFDVYPQFGTIEQVFAEASGSILFLGNRHLLRFNPRDSSLTKLAEPTQVTWLGGFQHTDSTIYVNQGGKGLLKVTGTQLVAAPEGYRFNDEAPQNRNQDMTIKFGTRYVVRGQTYSLIGTASGRLFFFDGKDLTMFQTAGTAERLKTAGLRAGLQVRADMLALGTATSGVWLVRTASLEELQRINVQAGLPDNQVQALVQGPNNGLWIAHQQGISRVAIDFPVTDVGVYPGLAGSPTATTEFDGQFFIGTTSGVFRSKQASGNALSGTQAAELRETARAKAEAELEPAIEAETLKRLRKLGKTKERNRLSYNSIYATVKREFAQDRRAWLEERTQLYLRELSAEGDGGLSFERVRGIAGRTKQFLTALDQLIVVTTAGVFQVEGLESRSLFDKGSVNRAFAVDSDSLLLLAGELGVYVLQYTETEARRGRPAKASWQDKGSVSGVNENVLEIVRTDDGTLWAAGDATQAIRIPPLDEYGESTGLVGDDDRFTILKDYAREVQLRILHGRLRFVTRQGVFRLARSGGGFESDPVFVRFPAQSVYADSPFGAVWVAASDKLFRLRFSDSDPAALAEEVKRLKQDASNSRLPSEELVARAKRLLAAEDKLLAIDTFHATRSLEASITAIHPSATDADVVFLQVGQKLYRFRASEVQLTPRAFRAYIRAVYSNQDTTNAPSELPLVLRRGVRDLTFQVGAANYTVENGLSFEYKFSDEDDTWETLPLGVDYVTKRDLSAGEHTLRVRAVDVFGNYSEEATYSYRVPIPFWKEYWRELLGFGAAGLLLLGVLGFFWQRRIARRREEKLAADKAFYRRSTRVLLDNILPPKIARDLEQRIDRALEESPDNFSIENLQKPPLEAFERVSVLFTDFKGFTSVAKHMATHELSDLLNENFLEFDRITKTNRLEKIKTIGDAYMAAGGLPDANRTNPVDAVLTGLQIQAYMRRWVHRRESAGLPAWQCRVGVHTGTLTAGIIASYKFAYDCWGDTVNTASRMESNGEVGKVNISGETYQLVKDFFDCSPRGALVVKNRGAVEQYFVEGIRPGLHEPGHPEVPNEAFWHLLNETYPPSSPTVPTETNKRLPKDDVLAARKKLGKESATVAQTSSSEPAKRVKKPTVTD